jgi:uncharacterized membrane protein
MNRESVEAIKLVLATLNIDDVYPTQRKLLREALEAAKKSQEQISWLSELCVTLNKLQETAVQMIKPAVDTAVYKEREACARIIDGMADDMEREMEPSYAIGWVRSKAAEIRARGEK